MTKVGEAGSFSCACPMERNAGTISCAVITTLVALAAIAAGITAILAALPNPPPGLGIMSEVGMKGASIMVAAGGTLFIITMVIASRLKPAEAHPAARLEGSVAMNTTVQPIDWQEPEEAFLTLDENNTWIKAYTNTEFEALCEQKQQAKLKEIQKTSAETTSLNKSQMRAIEQEAQKEAAQPILEQLAHLYRTGGGKAPYLPVMYNPHKDESLLNKQFELILMSTDQILALPIDQMERFDPYQMNILLQRVQMILELLADVVNEDRANKEQAPTTLKMLLTLSQPTEIMAMIEQRPAFAGLLSASQVLTLLKEPLPTGLGFFKRDLLKEEEWISRLLPINTRAEKEYTRRKLFQLNAHDNAALRLSQLPPAHILFCPDTYFVGAHWHWTPERFQTFLHFEKSETKEFTRIMQTLNMKTIRQLNDQLTAEHFNYFSHAQLRDDNFPWVNFSQKEGWGRIARTKIQLHAPVDPIGQGRTGVSLREFSALPWQLMNPKAIKEFFKPESQNQSQKQDLKLLDMTFIQKLEEIWSLAHLKFFSHEQRANPDFPWKLFLKPGIGQALREIYNEGKLLAQISLPWDQLDAFETGVLFTVESMEIKKTEELLRHLDFDKIVAIAPGLNVAHLSFLLGEFLSQNRFPWNLFFPQKGIGAFLRSKDKLTISAQSWLPWKLLPADEIDSLFSGISSNRPFFQAFDASTISLLAPELKVHYIGYCSLKQTGDAKFPWQAFLEKEGIGIEIRRAYTTIGLQNIPWEEGCMPEEEIEKMLNPKANFATSGVCPIKEFLEALPTVAIQAVQKQLQPEALKLFSFMKLIDQFPWKAFLGKTGIGEQLSQVLTQYKGDSKPALLGEQIPWNEFGSANEFITALSGSGGDTYVKQEAMKNIPLACFNQLCHKFDTKIFEQIANTALYEYERSLGSWLSKAQQEALKELSHTDVT